MLKRAEIGGYLILLGLLFLSPVQLVGQTESSQPKDQTQAAICDHDLRILSPTILELTLITERAETARAHPWEIFGTAGHALPALNEIAVTINELPVAVTAIGFKRRVLSAPLARWNVRVGHHLYLRLARPTDNGATVRVKNLSPNLWPIELSFAAKAESARLSPAIHINQMGYTPMLTKRAIVGFYLGSMGELEVPKDAMFSLIDERSGKKVYTGALRARVENGFSYRTAPYQQVLEADFSAVTQPGKYRVFIPGLGGSLPFLIHEGIPAAFARTYALGLYHQRCGAENSLPYTRFTHAICHIAPAAVPTPAFATVQKHLGETASLGREANVVPLTRIEASLFPFVRQGYVDVSGGHHDAGDYSKYTINSAHLIHHLVFAVDALAGVAELDNLGLPESGDGKSDLLQIAKWEADFLVKMQDDDGGFYFLVYPRERRYEGDVLPDHGDPQVVFPKNTAATAAAVAALAQTASSPRFQKQFPAAAVIYQAAAKKGWSFLERAWQKYGAKNSYQKITHYGDWAEDKDEIAWAATELYLLTGESQFHDKLLGEFSPQELKTRRWGWWRLFESYGNAVRSYAFAVRTGRVKKAALNGSHLAQSEHEIIAAAEDKLRWSEGNSYGTSFSFEDKRFRTAGWYFPIASAFDLAVAYQLDPRAAFMASIIANIDFESGTNPNNVAFLTGIGWQRQREIVHQYAQNDQRVLPPSGIPIGSVQSGFQYTRRYQRELSKLTFPSDTDGNEPFPLYDRWSDTFNTTTEFTIVTQGRGLALLAYMMAQTPLRKQPWSKARAEIAGVPDKVSAGSVLTARLNVPGLDLTDAVLVWEGNGSEPAFARQFELKPAKAGRHWLEVEALWPDGRRAFGRREFRVVAGGE